MSGWGNEEPGSDTHVITMPRLYLFFVPKLYFLFIILFFILYSLFYLEANLNEDKEKGKQQYEKEYESPSLAGELERHFILEKKDTR